MAMMGLREYSRHRGCALRAVQKAIEAGRIRLVDTPAGKKVDSDQADRDWVLNTDPAKQSLLHSPGPQLGQAALPLASAPAPGGEAPAPAATPGGEEAGEGAIADEHSPAFRKARAEQMEIRVSRERIELEQLRGSLIGLDEAKRLAYTAFRSLRDAVLNVPARIKDQCAAETDSFKIEQIIDAELSAALQSFNPARVLVEATEDDAD